MYPRVRLTRFIRLIIMLALIGSFFVISPILIMYTAGYRYDWQSRELRQTGVISIDILPADAAIYLNSVKINKKSPLRLANRAPGNYTIKFSKSGYQDWQKEITVESKKTIYLKNITLFKLTLPVLINDERKKNIIDLDFSADGRYVLLIFKNNANKEQDNVYDIDILETGTKKVTSIMRAGSLERPKIFWSPYDSLALIATKNETYNLNLFDPSSPEKIQSFSSSSPIAPTSSLWRVKDSKIIQDSGEQFKNLSAQKFYFNAGTGEWLAWSPWELWSVYPDGDVVLLTRTGEKMENVIPLDAYGVLLLQSGNALKAFNPGYYTLHELLKNVEIKKAGANAAARKIFFWGKVGQMEGIFELEY